MKEILLIARNDGQCNEWFRYLYEHISSVSRSKSHLAMDILTKEYRICIRPKSVRCYRGRRPDYYYAYGLEANSYLLSTGSKRLRSLDDVINIVKGDNYEL